MVNNSKNINLNILKLLIKLLNFQDLGGSMTGDAGKSTRAADLVVEEIKAKNGIAVANYGSKSRCLFS